MDIQAAIKAHYDTIAEEFAHVDQGTGFVLEKVQVAEDASILDIGCGTGNLTFRLIDKVPHGRIVGLDISEGVLEVARRRAQEIPTPRFEFVQSQSEGFPFADGEFDAVVSNMALQLFPDREQALSEVIRILRPGGKAFLRFLGGAPSASTWMDLLGAAWMEVTRQPPESNLLYNLLSHDYVHVDSIGEWLSGYGVEEFEINWRKNATRVVESQFQMAGQMRRLTGDFWKASVSADGAQRIDEMIEKKIQSESRSKGFLESTMSVLLVTFFKP